MMNLLLNKKNLLLLVGVLIAIFIGFSVMSFPLNLTSAGQKPERANIELAKEKIKLSNFNLFSK